MMNKYRVILAAVACLALATTVQADASAFYVAQSGDGSLGTSWATAFTNLQTAIDAAQPNDTIHLKAETFVLSETNLPTGKLYWGADKHDLTIAGGYAGTGPEPGPLAGTPTVLQNLAAAANTTNRLLYVKDVTNGVLRNLVFRGGQIGWTGPQIVVGMHFQGAGIYMTGCTNMVLDSVTLRDNYVYGQQGGQTYGGGMYALNSYGVITNSLVQGNWLQRFYGTAAFGSGLHVAGGGWLIRDTVVRNNTTAYDATNGDTCRGVGLYIDGGTHRIVNCLFARNYGASRSTPQGEAIYVAGGATEIENCTLFWHRYEGLRQAGGTVTLRNSIIWDCGTSVAGTVTRVHSAVQGMDGAADPQFERGLFLAPASPYHDAGDRSTAAAGLDGYTVRADGAPDAGDVALGYHFPPGTTVRDYYVDAINGSDAYTGLTSELPLKTITRALALIDHGSHVYIAAGSYNLASGETFPLTVANRYGIQLLGTNSLTTVISPAGTNSQGLSFSFIYPDACLSGLSVTGAYFYAGAAYGAGAYVRHSRMLVNDCRFVSNRSHTDSQAGGGWGATRAGGFYAEASEGMLSNCVIRANRTTVGYSHSSSLAGGAYLDGVWTVEACAVTDNEAQTDVGWGAWTVFGGGLYLNGAITVRNTLIANNWSHRKDDNNAYEFGDGAYVASGEAVFDNCTVATNHGEGIRRDGGMVTVNNAILWGNGVDVAGAITANWSNVGQASTNAILNDCISADPRFVDAATGNYRLNVKNASRSPSINAGNPVAAAWMSDAGDLDGTPRILDRRVDQGAYEHLISPSGMMILMR